MRVETVNGDVTFVPNKDGRLAQDPQREETHLYNRSRRKRKGARE